MTTYTVFGSTTPNVVNANDSDDYALGTVVQIASGGTITHARWYFSNPLPTGTVTWYCADLSTHDILGSQAFTSPSSGWFQQAITPIVITGARNVLLWVGTPNGYVYTNGFFTAAGVTSGPLTAPRSSSDPEGIGNGRFGGTPTSYPAGTSSATCYFADMVFSVAPAVGTAAMDISYTFAATGAAATPPTPAVTRGGWGSLYGVLNGQRADAEQYAERLRNPVECPEHKTQLDQNAEGVLHCVFGGHIVRRG